MDPANARLIAHFGLALANLAVAEKTDPDDARRARAEADYQTHRAVKPLRRRYSGSRRAPRHPIFHAGRANI
jgi:hypothetical protein